MPVASRSNGTEAFSYIEERVHSLAELLTNGKVRTDSSNLKKPTNIQRNGDEDEDVACDTESQLELFATSRHFFIYCG